MSTATAEVTFLRRLTPSVMAVTGEWSSATWPRLHESDLCAVDVLGHDWGGSCTDEGRIR
jgi:hypothetical protein